MSRQNRATPAQIKVWQCCTFLRTPLSHLPLIRSSQTARRVGGRFRGTFGFRKRIALQGGIAATVTPAALLCATKLLKKRLILLPAQRVRRTATMKENCTPLCAAPWSTLWKKGTAKRTVIDCPKVSYPKNLFVFFFFFPLPCKAKITLRGKNYLGNANSIPVLRVFSEGL